MKFHEKITKLAADRDMKQAQLIRRTGIGQSTMSQLMHGQREPSLNQASLLAKALGVTTDYLADDEADEPPQPYSDDERKIIVLVRRLTAKHGYAFEDFAERLFIEDIGWEGKAPPTEQGRPKGGASGGPKPRTSLG